jgi:hypothetical protein
MGFIRGFVPLGKLWVVAREYSILTDSIQLRQELAVTHRRLPKLKLTHCSQTDKSTPQQKRPKCKPLRT